MHEEKGVRNLLPYPPEPAPQPAASTLFARGPHPGRELVASPAANRLDRGQLVNQARPLLREVRTTIREKKRKNGVGNGSGTVPDPNPDYP
jgi:hypothetical protein